MATTGLSNTSQSVQSPQAKWGSSCSSCDLSGGLHQPGKHRMKSNGLWNTCEPHCRRDSLDNTKILQPWRVTWVKWYQNNLSIRQTATASSKFLVHFCNIWFPGSGSSRNLNSPSCSSIIYSALSNKRLNVLTGDVSRNGQVGINCWSISGPRTMLNAKPNIKQAKAQIIAPHQQTMHLDNQSSKHRQISLKNIEKKHSTALYSQRVVSLDVLGA